MVSIGTVNIQLQVADSISGCVIKDTKQIDAKSKVIPFVQPMAVAA